MTQNSASAVTKGMFCRSLMARLLGMGRLARLGRAGARLDVERTGDDVGFVEVVAREFAQDAAVIHDGDAVAAADQLVIVGRIEQHRRALIGELANEPVE